MGTTVEEFKRARAEGRLDDLREPKVDTTQKIPTTVNPDYIPPEVLESVVALEDEVSTGQYITGTALGAVGEIGLGLYGTHKLHQSQKYLRWANNAKRLSTIGIVSPEPTTTVLGVAGLAASEALIWAGSNFVGQTIRKVYGVQDSYSAGESIASSVFGIGLVTKAADKVFRLSAPSLASQNAWKGKELVVNGVKTFVSGAALGLAESALRQEIEAHLNGTDRNVYDYMFSSAAGGAFNTVFSVWARTGKWGREKGVSVVKEAKDNLEKKKVELQTKLAEVDKPVKPDPKTSILSGGKTTAPESRAQNQRIKHEYQKQIRDIEQAQATLDDSINELIAANDNLSKQETNPTVKEEPEVEVEDVSKQLEEADPIVEREGEQLTEKDLEVPPERRVAEEEPTPVKEEAEEPEVTKEGWQTTKEVKGDSKVEIQTSSWKGVDEDGDPVEVVVKWYNGKYQGTKTYLLKPDGSRGGQTNSIVYKVTEDKLKQGDLSALPEVIKQQPGTFKKEEVEVKEPEVVEEPKKPEAVRERNVEDAREDQLDTLIERIKNIDTTPDKGTLSVEGPKINREGKAIADANIERMNGLIRLFVKNPQDKNIAQAMLDEIKFSRAFNRNVTDWWNTTGGRLVQSQRGDADQYEWASKYSIRAQLQDEALARLQVTLEAKTRGIVDGDEADIQQMFDEYLAIPDELQKRRPRVKKEEEDVTEVFKEPKVETEVDVETQPTKEVTKKLSKRKDGLKQKLKKLEETREEFAGLREEVEPKKAKVKTEEETDIENRLGFYKSAKKEAKETALLENKLERYLELLEEGDIEKIRQEVGPAPDWAKPKEVESYLGKLRSVVNKTKKLLKKELIDQDEVLKLKEADAVNRQRKRLEDKLQQLQERFGDRSKLTPKQKKELQEDPDIADLKQRIKFYEEAEAGTLELERLEAELAKVAELDVAPLGEQRAGVEPKPTGPRKVNLKAAKIRKQIAATKANIKQRLKDIDQARREMDEGFQAEKAEQELNKKISTLEQELEELRTTFGDEPVEGVVVTPKEKAPEVKDLEDKIRFYKEAQAEVKKIKELETERARLLEIETGPLGAQRAEITPKPKGPKKAPGKVDELNKEIAFLRKNMRNRVAEIDRARVEMSDEFKAEKLRKAYEAKRDKLQKELDTLRKRFAKIDEAEEAAGLKPKKKKKDPRIKELEQKVKYYKEAEKEALALVALEKELARVADIEGRGIVGELVKETTPTPKGPKKPLKSESIKKKIAASRARMKKKLADLERARKEIEEARLTEKAFKDLEESFYKALEKDTSSLLTKGWGWLKMGRQLSLIDQAPSAFAGVPTGVGAVAKQFFRPATTFLYNPSNARLGLRARLALADLTGALKIISDLKGLGLEVRRTFAENVSAIDNRAGKLSDEINARSLPRGEHALVARAYTSAKRRAEALDNTSNWFTNTIKNGQLFYIWTLGVRGIQAIDSGFKRQIIKGRIHAEAHKRAMLEFPNDSIKAQKNGEKRYGAAFKDSDGLAVLNDIHEFEDVVNQIREELLFASNGNLEDLPKNRVEKLINRLKDTVNDGGIIGNFIDAMAPYLGVPIRAIYRGARISFAPAQTVGAFIPLVDRHVNPFQNKVKELELKLEAQFERLRKSDDPMIKEQVNEELKDLKRRRDQAAERRLKYNEELITDSFLSTSLYFTGGVAALYYGATGSLEWLTPEQRKKNKLQSFQMFGSDYSAAQPWAFPLALAADVAGWFKIKKEEWETGAQILTKDQDLEFVIGASLKKLAEAMPLAQGVQTADEIARFEGDITKNAISRLIASYVPIPAQVRKITQTLTQEGIPDLRGAGYYDRIVYSVLGSGIQNRKTNLLGQDEESTATWITQNIARQAPRKELDRTRFDEIVASDTHGNIAGKPSTLEGGIKMTDYVNEDGMTLAYAFDQQLKNKTIRVKELKNKKYTIEGAVNALITSTSWNQKYAKGFQVDEESGRLKNEGLVELNKVLNSFYRETKKDILKDNAFINRFIDENDESLYYILQTRKSVVAPEVRPTSPLEILTR